MPIEHLEWLLAGGCEDEVVPIDMTYQAKAKGAPELGTAGGPDGTFRGPWATSRLSPNFYT